MSSKRLSLHRAAALILNLALALLSAPAAKALPWDASGADSLNVTILGHYPVESATGIWGCAAYADGEGGEFGILGADSLHIIDLSDPTQPRRTAVFPPASPPDDNYYVHVDTWDHYAYAAGRYGPIRIVDLADPHNPVTVGLIPGGEFCACSCGHPCNNWPQDHHQPVIET
ncbi:MAG: hypothetical protein GF355_07725, partial [Candidatus Eisenbacteria bacterium]|nr:hypothetical protein [Candidatus Eisenbacteria bacterium]